MRPRHWDPSLYQCGYRYGLSVGKLGLLGEKTALILLVSSLPTINASSSERKLNLKPVPPYATGGNIDTKHITAGSRISLPVQVEGALFSLGDGHALQGDGEVCGAAIETCVTATVRITLHPASSLPYAVRQPHYTTPPQVEVGELEREGFHTTMGIAPDLLEAAKLALNYMIEYMCGIADGAIEKEDAYMLCSVVGDLHACEVVDMPNYAMGFRMPE